MSKGKNKNNVLTSIPTTQPVVIDDKAPRKAVATEPAGTAKCIDCGAVIQLSKVTYNKPSKAGDMTAILPSHGRCEKCQTIYLCNERAKKFDKACELLGNMKSRILLHFGVDGLNYLMLNCENSYKDKVVAVFNNAKVATKAFDISALNS